jgi:hypothetical protein
MKLTRSLAWVALVGLLAALSSAWVNSPPGSLADNPGPPAGPVKLIFIHHSTGENWLADDNGGLGSTLLDNHYFVSDTNYGWGPAYGADPGSGQTIGDRTDIPDWFSWFSGPDRDSYLAALYVESDQHASYSRLATDPGGENRIVMFKSCFPNSNLDGNATDAPAAYADNTSELTVANAKRIYLDLLAYFATHQDKLFVAVTAPPLAAGETDAVRAANARAFDNWLVHDWLADYPHPNVAVFDFYNVLTSNGGDPDTNDVGQASGNHHRWWNNAEQHIQAADNNYSAYPTGDSHPSQAGNQKATAEFWPLLNVFYHRWQAGGAPAPAPVATVVIGDEGGSVTSPDGSTSIQLPPAAVGAPTVITYTGQDCQNPGRLACTDHAFDLSAAAQAGGAPVSTFDRPVTVAVRYGTGSTWGAIPATLGLYWMSGGTWLTSGITLVARDDHAISSTTTHFTSFALLGETLRAYLPLTMR